MTEAIKIRYRLGEPFEVVGPVQLDVALSAKEPSNAFLAAAQSIAAGVVVVYVQSFVGRSKRIGPGAANSALVSLRGVHFDEPLFVYLVLIEPDLSYFVLLVFRPSPLHYLRVRLALFFSLLSGGLQARLLVSVVAVARHFVVSFSIILYPITMALISTFFAPRTSSVFSVAHPIEHFKREFLKTTKTPTRSGVRLFGRGHCRSSQRLGFVRRLQRLTPSFYHLEAIYGR